MAMSVQQLIIELQKADPKWTVICKPVIGDDKDIVGVNYDEEPVLIVYE